MIPEERHGKGWRGLLEYIVFQKEDVTNAANESFYPLEKQVERNPHGHRIELPGLVDNESRFIGSARRDASKSIANMRQLSGGGLARIGACPRLFLPGDASADLGLRSAPALAGLRRSGDGDAAGTTEKGGARSSGLKRPKKKREIRGEFIAGTLQGTPREMSRQAAPFRSARPDVAAPVMHYSLSLQAGDGRKTPEEWRPIVESFLKRMDFPLDAAWTSFLHNDTAHQHCHIAFLRSLGDGQVWNREFSAKRAIQASAEIEREFGLLTHDRTPKRERERLTRKEQELVNHVNQLKKEGKTMSKLFIKRAVDDFISARAGQEFNVEELRAALAQQGIELDTVQRDGSLAGIKFQSEGVWIAGSSLGDDYKAQGLLKRGLKHAQAQAKHDPAPGAAPTSVVADFQARGDSHAQSQPTPHVGTNVPVNGIGRAIVAAPAGPRKRTRSNAEVRSRHTRTLAALSGAVYDLTAAGWNSLAKLVVALVNSILKALEVVFSLREGALGRLDEESVGAVIPPRLKSDDGDYEQILDAMDTVAPALESMAKKVESHQFSQLLEHGAAPYQFKSEASESYFARLKLPDGTETVLWGVDIKRALEEAKAAEGDFLALSRAGSQMVTIKERQADGSEIPREVHRNAWTVQLAELDAAAVEEEEEEEESARRSHERPRG